MIWILNFKHYNFNWVKILSAKYSLEKWGYVKNISMTSNWYNSYTKFIKEISNREFKLMVLGIFTPLTINFTFSNTEEIVFLEMYRKGSYFRIPAIKKHYSKKRYQ